MIKDQFYLIKQKKILLRRKKIKFKLESQLKKINFVFRVYQYKYLLFIQYIIDSSEDFLKLKSYLENNNSNLILFSKDNLNTSKFSFLLQTNNAVIGINNLDTLNIIYKELLKKKFNLLILGILIDSVFFSKYDFNSTILNKNAVIIFLFNQLLNFVNIFKSLIYTLIFKLQNIIKNGNY